MINTKTELLNFRNHIDSKVEWAPHLNVITGPNGAGKTSLIDAIHYLCMSRSFTATSDLYVVHQDESYFMIKGHFEGEIRSEFEVACSYSRKEGKKIFVNDSPLDKLSDLIGMVPVVTLTPDDKKLTLEGPAERRSYLDSFISQISTAYLRDLIEFRKIRKHRNALLQEYNGPLNILETYLEPWNIQLIETGSRIIAKRHEVLESLRNYLEKDYIMISGMDLTAKFVYQTICEPTSNIETIKESYTRQLQDVQEKEIEREITTIGPHRDEVIFYLDDFELRKFGSQGQHRLFTLALKMAQLHYYSDELDDLPILMLDDLFGDLDRSKTEVLLDALQQHQGQIFITSANTLPFEEFIPFDGDNNRKYHVDNGTVKEITHEI